MFYDVSCQRPRCVGSDLPSHGSHAEGKDFCRVESGVFALELCFVQLAQSLSFHELVRAGNVLCGRFYLDAGKGGELGDAGLLLEASH